MKIRELNFPNPDPRWKKIHAEMAQYGFTKDSLIQILHAIQENFGFLDKPSLNFVANTLNIPFSEVYGVATFYHYFTLKPPTKHSCTICTGTACYIKGADKLLNSLKTEFNLEPGESTPNQELSLFTARCVGACGIAPVAILDNNIHGCINPDTLISLIKSTISIQD